MLVRSDGSLSGTIGGGCGEAGVIQKARLSLQDGKIREDLADLTESNQGAVGPREDHDLLELDAVIGLPLGAKQNLTAWGLDRTPRQIEGGVAHRPGDRIEIEPVAPQSLF